MSKTPAPNISSGQLGLRFVLELVALFSIGRGAMLLVDGAIAWFVAVGVPVAVAVAWGTFAVRGDPSRSGNAPVPVPGTMRLALELFVFGLGAVGLAVRHDWIVLGVFVVALGMHHFATRARLRWLMEQ